MLRDVMGLARRQPFGLQRAAIGRYRHHAAVRRRPRDRRFDRPSKTRQEMCCDPETSVSTAAPDDPDRKARCQHDHSCQPSTQGVVHPATAAGFARTATPPRRLAPRACHVDRPRRDDAVDPNCARRRTRPCLWRKRRQNLIATVRRRLVSVARYTSPMPPTLSEQPVHTVRCECQT